MAHHQPATITAPRHPAPRSHDHHINGHDCVQVHGDHRGRHQPHEHQEANHRAPSLDRTALMATLHCLSGCTIGEVLGMAIARRWAGAIGRRSALRLCWHSSSGMP